MKSNSMGGKLAVSNVPNILRDTNSKRPGTTMPTGMPIWERLILRRITPFWDKHDALKDAQHCRSRRGCSAAPIPFQAALETAQESGTDVYMSSWDIQRAYESPSKHI